MSLELGQKFSLLSPCNAVNKIGIVIAFCIFKSSGNSDTETANAYAVCCGFEFGVSGQTTYEYNLIHNLHLSKLLSDYDCSEQTIGDVINTLEFRDEFCFTCKIN